MNVSVVIPALNEEENLKEALPDLASQLDKDDQLILVDNESEDGTVEVAKKFADKVFVVEREASIGSLRQFGTEQADNEIIVSTDADIKGFAENYIQRLKEHFKNGYDLVAGPIKDSEGRELVDFFSHAFTKVMGGIGGNLAFTKNLFKKTLGYPDKSFGEDVVLTQRLLDKAEKFKYDDQNFIEHKLDEDWERGSIIALSIFITWSRDFLQGMWTGRIWGISWSEKDWD